MSQEQYGINVGSHQVIQDSFPDNQLLVDVLQHFGVERSVIDTIDAKTAEGFDVRNMQAGHPYTILRSTESQDVEFFIYEETEEDYVVIDLRDGVNISRGNQPVSTELNSVFLPINSSLYESTRAQGVDVSLVKSLENIFASQVDFRHLDAGDYCKVIFEERYVDGNFIGLGKVLASEFRQGDNLYQAFLHELNDSISVYLDEEGASLTQAFLPYPVDSSSLISMEYNSRSQCYRVHTQQADEPVLAMADGTIAGVFSTKNRGMEVELMYSNVTRFQYRYLNNLVEDLRTGDKIFQGDTLGFAGNLRTGKSGLEVSIWQFGEKTEGLPIVDSSTISIPAIDQENFRKTRKKMGRLLSKIEQNLI